MSEREVIVRPARERRQQVVDYLTQLGAPATLMQIAQAVGMSKSGMARLAERLKADGVIRPAGRTRTSPAGHAGRHAHLWALSWAADAGEDDGARVMAWTARQAVTTTDLPHRAVSDATRAAARGAR